MPVRVSALPNSWSPFHKCAKLTNQRASFFFKISVHLKILLNLLENFFAINYVIRPILTSWSRFSWFITSFRAKTFSKQHHACQINLALTKVLILTLYSELRNRIVTMSCPFLKNVSRSMFQQSELTLKDAMRGNGLVLEFRALFESKKLTFQNCWKKIPKLSEYFASPTKSMPLYAAAKVRSQHEIGSDAAAF